MLSPRSLNVTPPHRVARGRRSRTSRAQARPRAGDRRRGLGAPALLFWLRGRGHAWRIDDDSVALSNLQRQVIHGTPRLAIQGRERGRRDPPPQSACDGRDHAARLVAANALDLIARMTSSPTGRQFRHRYLVSTPVSFAKSRRHGCRRDVRRHAHTLRPYARADGAPNPTYRCLFPSRRHRAAFRLRGGRILGALTGVSARDGARGDREIRRFWRGLVGVSSCSTPAPCASRHCSTAGTVQSASGEHSTIHDLSAHA